MAEYIDRRLALEDILSLMVNLEDAEDKKMAEIYNAGVEESHDAVSLCPLADVAPVRQGRWIHKETHMWFEDEDGEIDIWRCENGFHNGPECQVCGATPCIHCRPDWKEMKCKKGYYVCSVCSAESADNKPFCSDCGAKMDKK